MLSVATAGGSISKSMGRAAARRKRGRVARRSLREGILVGWVGWGWLWLKKGVVFCGKRKALD